MDLGGRGRWRCSRGRWVFGQRRGRVLEGEQGIGEMVKGLAYTVGVRDGDGEENVVAAVVVYSGGEVEVESPSPMFCP